MIPELASDPDQADRHAHAAENHRPGCTAAAHEIAAEDAAVGREEFSRLAVPEREDADTAADVGLDAIVPAIGRNRTVAVNGTTRSLRLCSISVPLAFWKSR